MIKWLDDRFYEDEVDALERVSASDKNLAAKLCAVLGVDCDEDLEFTKRIKEKKAFLASKTDDENIIDNAIITALDQDDLANLLHMDYKTIYLCGENFTVPIRMTDRKYIGVLSTPKIKIKANSDEELAAQNISFENCKLAWQKESPLDALKALAAKIFGTNGEWLIVDEQLKTVSSYDKLSAAEKAIAVDMCCHGKYKESQVVFLFIRDDISDGFAFTNDAFCTGGASGGNVIKYNQILSVDSRGYELNVYNQSGIRIYSSWDFPSFFNYHDDLNLKVKKFLDVVKNF